MWAVIVTLLLAAFVFAISRPNIKYWLALITILIGLPLSTYTIYGLQMTLETMGATQLISDIFMIIASLYVEPFTIFMGNETSVPFVIAGVPTIIVTLVCGSQIVTARSKEQ